MNPIRFGVIGTGTMGGFHAHYLSKGEIENATLAAVCDVDPATLERVSKQTGAAAFSNHKALLDAKLCDAVIIATPHYFHPPIALEAFAAGLHVMSEKPVAVTVKQARLLNDQYRASYAHLKFGVMFQTRTSPLYIKVRQLIADGELGEITRITWTATAWFRTWTYYASGGWRATWAGEGGGVLINQNPHNLDLLWWLTGLTPKRITAVAAIGKTHPIEVEDEVSAILEYPNGAIGHFITTTGEAPGTDRLEIAGDRGRIVVEHGKIAFSRTRKSVSEVNRTSPDMFAYVEAWDIDVPYHRGAPEGHKVVTAAFVRSILRGEPMIAPGVEGVHGLEIGNAMLMAGLTGRPVDLPVDGDAYEQFLKDLTKKYGGRKTLNTKAVEADVEKSWAK